MRKNDLNVILRLPRELKSAIERKAGQGRMSEFIRLATEEKLATVCHRCHGTGKVLKKAKTA